jgi:hypothetical protein
MLVVTPALSSEKQKYFHTLPNTPLGKTALVEKSLLII